MSEGKCHHPAEPRPNAAGLPEEPTHRVSCANQYSWSPCDCDILERTQAYANTLRAAAEAAMRDARRLDWIERNVSAIRDIGWLGGDLRSAIDTASAKER